MPHAWYQVSLQATEKEWSMTMLHRITNVHDTLPKKHQAEAHTLLCVMPYGDTQATCEALRGQLSNRYQKLAPKAVERPADD